MAVFAKTSEKFVLAGLAAAVAALTAIGLSSLRINWAQSSESLAPAADTHQQPPPLPRMVIQQRFAGPFPGTEIDRWRDPLDGTVCYIYFPTVVRRTPAPSGYYDYGSNAIGSISCLSPGAQVPPAGQRALPDAGPPLPR
jgi:hypothetical protein